jgi:protein kinase A
MFFNSPADLPPLVSRLGTGSFGRVHLVKSRHNSRYYAVKVLGKEKVVRMKQVEHTNSEREMLVRVRHPFLVNLWGTFADPKNLYMVMDFVAGGELFSLLRKSQVRSPLLIPSQAV